MITGYKCFNKGLINRYGMQFELGKTYHMDGDIAFQKQGFHMCSYLEDTLRYFDAFNGEVEIALVEGYGNINKYDDEYNGFYDMYAVEYIKIEHILSRDEIINYALSLVPYRAIRFLSLFKLTSDEEKLFRDTFYDDNMVIKTIDYYQKNDTKAFVKRK